jgi:hypothetical protein
VVSRKRLAVAYAIEGLMITWLPVREWLGAGAGLLALPLAVGIGIPVYLNSCAAIPFISGLIGLGMSPATMQIHYRIEGAGSPLVLQHGFTESIEDWFECGYVDALKSDYRLILIDARAWRQ